MNFTIQNITSLESENHEKTAIRVPKQQKPIFRKVQKSIFSEALNSS